MDNLLTAFLVFNIVATALTLIAFAAMREPIAVTWRAQKKKFRT